MKKDSLATKLSSLAKMKTRMKGRDFLLTWEQSLDEIKATALTADILKDLHQQGKSLRLFDSGLAISIFRDKSTRTRFSFASAANLLGLAVSDLDEEKSQISHGETVRETANMISFLTETIGIRDDMFLGEGNKYMLEVAEAVTEGYREGVLHQRPNIVNLQCDIDHPTQTMADLLHLVNYFGGFENLRGRKIAMTWAYSPSYGKPLSVPQGIIGLLTRFGMKVSLAHPPGYDLLPEVVKIAQRNAAESQCSFEIVNSMEEAFRDADIVYPKSWAPFKVMERRTELLRKNDRPGLVELERECLANNAKFTSWECDAKKMSLTREGKALYMHCLPADITDVSCKQGEVSKEVFEKYRLDTYREAGYKPFAIAAMILLSKYEGPARLLHNLASKKSHRVVSQKSK